ncbi:DUF547 domain-containing protein [uncultured Winogradskyella sp.]|uniref:DUF547 domain-containing protein n=1 Tax=uncultured Winogradskyella sp. TaxID=395353 RepID=UPI00260EFD89|nr:DUF547 domain-containing protein [uncultured Winogradskyella sp.]
MKLVLIFILTFFASSCCGTKHVVETQTQTTKDIAIVSEAPVTVKTTKEHEVEDYIKALKEKDSTVKIISVDSSKILYSKKETTVNMPPLIAERVKKDSNVKSKLRFDHSRWDFLLKGYVTDEGKVDYKKFKKNHSALLNYINELQGDFLDIEASTKEDKLVYWINAYNALTVDLIIRNHPLKSIKEIKDPWDQRLWKFGDKWLNLNDIEHKILRKMNEPRIHFAIVCASASCPKLQNKAYTVSHLDEQLTDATKEFLSDSSKNELSKDRIKLSKIFKWFAKDFKQNGSLIDFLNQYTDVTISNNAKRSFKDYSWELND